MYRHLLHPHTSLLMVVDLQEKFVPAIYEPEALVHRAGILMDAAKALDVPIVVTEHYTKGLGYTVPVLRERCQHPGVTVMEKTAFGALAESSIGASFQGLKKERPQIVVCGLEAHICVNQTVHQLLSEGFEVHVVEDAISSRTVANKLNGWTKMIHSGAVATNSESVLFEWMADAKHPAFKPIQALIK